MAVQRPTPSRSLSITGARWRARCRGRLDRRRVSALAVAVIVGWLVAGLVDRSRDVVAALGTVQDVAVATTDIAAGSTLSQDQIELVAWPVGLVPAGALANVETAVGRVTTADIAAGEAINERRIGQHRLGLGAAERSVSFPMPLAPPPLQVGDVVELVGAGAGVDSDPSNRFMVSVAPLGRGRVVHLNDDAVTVAVDVDRVGPLIAQLAVGTVEIVGTPFHGHVRAESSTGSIDD